MSAKHAPGKGFEVISELEHIKAKLHELEALFEGRKAAAEIAAIRGLTTSHLGIEKKYKEFKAAGGALGEAKSAQLKAEIEAGLADLNAKLAQLASKAHAHST